MTYLLKFTSDLADVSGHLVLITLAAGLILFIATAAIGLSLKLWQDLF